jgi:hypothetical protein
MAFEDEAPLERAYPYRTGWRVIGCLMFGFTVLGVGGMALVPIGCDKIAAGNLPVGIAMAIIGVFGGLAQLLAIAAFISGVRETISPPTIRVSTTALLLPTNLREESTVEEQDENGEPKNLNQPPAHPEAIPFTAIRWIRREGPPNPGSDKLMIVHDLSQQTLVVEQYMMNAGDFDELEIVLRAAVPNAFASAPPTSESPTSETGGG